MPKILEAAVKRIKAKGHSTGEEKVTDHDRPECSHCGEPLVYVAGIPPFYGERKCFRCDEEDDARQAELDRACEYCGRTTLCDCYGYLV